eukprot:2863185-Pleurochrysis_carterae.AAC.1
MHYDSSCMPGDATANEKRIPWAERSGQSTKWLLPVPLRSHTCAKPHCCDPLVPNAQWAAGVLRLSVVHPVAHRARAVEEVAEEEHLPRLGHHFEPAAAEVGVAALVGHKAVRKAGRDALPLPVLVAVALAVLQGAGQRRRVKKQA